MKLFRLRFIILGLLLCVFHVWCRTCGTDFTDPMSSAYLADLVVEGRVTQSVPATAGKYNNTIRVSKIYKGKLGKIKKIRVSGFGVNIDKVNCVSNLTRRSTKYVFFLKNNGSPRDYVISAFPVASSRKVLRNIRKILCKRKRCGKKPVLRPLKGKSPKIGRHLTLRCRVRVAKPDAVFMWRKDGVVLKNRPGLRIKSGRKASRLKISKAKAGDAGSYTCVASNVLGVTISKSLDVEVIPRPPKRTTRPPKNGSTQSPRFTPCSKDREGWCFNGGICQTVQPLNVSKCQCPKEFAGFRCQERNIFQIPQTDIERANQQKDRTLTIIGIVIGILIFVCICIASYFLAKKRRDEFLRRQESKKRKNIPADSSYRPLDEVDGNITKMKPLASVGKMTMATQTEEMSFHPVNPNANMNLHINPINNILRNPNSAHNPNPQNTSRNRLSAVSIDGKLPPNRTSSGSGISPLADTTHQKEPSDTPKEKFVRFPSNEDLHQIRPTDAKLLESAPLNQKAPTPMYVGSSPTAPLPRMDSVNACSSDDEESPMTPLHISEDEHSLPRNRNLGRYPKSRFDTPPVRNPVYVNTNGQLATSSSQSLTSRSSSNSSFSTNEEELMLTSQPKYPYNGGSDISWNERGSPEHINLDADNSQGIGYIDKSYSPKIQTHMPNERHYKLRGICSDEPSIPI